MSRPRRDLFGHPIHARGERTGGDSYYTPPALADVLVGLLPLEPGDTVLEPSAGGGAFCRALEARGCLVHALDVDPRAPALNMPARPWRVQVGDFLSAKVGRPAWVVGNPPYRGAEDQIYRALEVADRGAAFLLRMALLAGQRRGPLWRSHPPAVVYVLPQRPSFTGGGTDQYDYMWCTWDAEHMGEPIVRWCPPYR
jgi:hypothetical protein